MQVMLTTINTACHNFSISGTLNFPSLASGSMSSLCCVLWGFRPSLQRSLVSRSHYRSPAHSAGITGHQPCANSAVPDLTMPTNSLLQSLPWELLSFPFLHLLFKKSLSNYRPVSWFYLQQNCFQELSVFCLYFYPFCFLLYQL